jgi:AAA domain/RepB DNA-primase N-terminal domain
MALDPKEYVAEEFLEWVWGDRFGWIDLPAKVGAYWQPWYYYWTGDSPDVFTARIDSCMRDGESLYFSMNRFSKKGRAEENCKSNLMLWADLDERHPSECVAMGLGPTCAWESSPGRYQAIWWLKQNVSPEVLARLNRALTYTVGADPGGWDLTQVLRLPGTRNFKYTGAPPVRLMWVDERVSYDVRELWQRIRANDPYREGSGPRKLAKRDAPAKAQALLRTPEDGVVEGERSTRLWELECLLAEAGWDEEEIFDAVSVCAWNKHRDHPSVLRREIAKAVRHVLREVPERFEDDEPDRSESPFISLESAITRHIPAPRWMVDGLWTQDAHGIIAGEPKTLKSTVALGLGIAVASGQPFMGLEDYAVNVQGPVLFVNEENAPYTVQDRLRRIMLESGLIDRDTVEVYETQEGETQPAMTVEVFENDALEDFRLLDNWGLNLAMEEHRDLLEGEIQREEPALVILDPLYLMLGGVNYDRHNELQPYLKWLKDIRYTYGCGIVVVHHYAKQRQDGIVKGGQRVLGSMTLHAWTDSAVYLSRRDSEDPLTTKTSIETEFRAQAPTDNRELVIHWGRSFEDFKVKMLSFSAADHLIAVLPQDGSEMSFSQAVDAMGGSRNDARIRQKVLSMARGTPEILIEERPHGDTVRRYLRLDLNGNLPQT